MASKVIKVVGDFRFYFISDEELLSVLAARDPSAVQEHLLKLFDNCAALSFGSGNGTATGMTSSEVNSLMLVLRLSSTASRHEDTFDPPNPSTTFSCMPMELIKRPVTGDVTGFCAGRGLLF